MISMPISAALIGQGNLAKELLKKIMSRQNDFHLQSVWLPDEDVESVMPDLGKHGIRLANCMEELLDDRRIQLVFNTSILSFTPFDDDRKEFVSRQFIHLVPALHAFGGYYGLQSECSEEYRHIVLLTPAAQAILPMITAVSKQYIIQEAEVISDIPSHAADRVLRGQLDEYMSATEFALTSKGGASKAKSMIFFNPDEISAVNRYMVHLKIEEEPDLSMMSAVLSSRAEEVAVDFPGYRLKYAPGYADNILTFVIEVRPWSEGLGAGLGHIDLMTSSAILAGERLALLNQRKGGNLNGE